MKLLQLARGFFRLVEMDRAVFYAVLGRAWQFLASPVSMLLIATFFTPEVQGFYYTFSSILALQMLAELGVNLVVLNTASHEWSRLRFDDRGRVTGDPNAHARLASLARLSLKWYAIASLLFVIGAGIAGGVFFGSVRDPGVNWLAPWIAVVCLTGLQLGMSPLTALLEGCNQVRTVNKWRMIQAIAMSLAAWTGIASGAQLWTPVAISLARLLCDVYLMGVRYRSFFGSLLARSAGTADPGVNWHSEFWPMQWRLALKTTFAYFAFFLFNPVMLSCHGAEVAGRMGMTMSALTAIQLAASAWVQTRVPRFGMLIAEGNYRELNRLFLRVWYFAMAMMAGVGAAFWCVVYTLNQIPAPVARHLADRVLSPEETAVFLLAVFLSVATTSQAMYLRAFKREPLLVPSLISSTAIGLSVIVFGSQIGPMGAGAGYLCVMVFFQLPCWTIARLRQARKCPGS